MNCKQIKPLLYDFLDNDLDLKIKSKIEEHLCLCPDCEAELQDIRKYKELMRSFEAQYPPAFFVDKVNSRINESHIKRLLRKIQFKIPLKLAGTFAVMIIAIYLFQPFLKTKYMQIAQADKTGKEEAKIITLPELKESNEVQALKDTGKTPLISKPLEDEILLSRKTPSPPVETTLEEQIIKQLDAPAPIIEIAFIYKPYPDVLKKDTAPKDSKIISIPAKEKQVLGKQQKTITPGQQIQEGISYDASSSGYGKDSDKMMASPVTPEQKQRRMQWMQNNIRKEKEAEEQKKLMKETEMLPEKIEAEISKPITPATKPERKVQEPHRSYDYDTGVSSGTAGDFAKMLEQKKHSIDSLLRLQKASEERSGQRKKIESELAKYNERLVQAEQQLENAEKDLVATNKQIKSIQGEKNKLKQQQSPIREELSDAIDLKNAFRKGLEKLKIEARELDIWIVQTVNKLGLNEKENQNLLKDDLYDKYLKIRKSQPYTKEQTSKKIKPVIKKAPAPEKLINIKIKEQGGKVLEKHYDTQNKLKYIIVKIDSSNYQDLINFLKSKGIIKDLPPSDKIPSHDKKLTIKINIENG